MLVESSDTVAPTSTEVNFNIHRDTHKAKGMFSEATVFGNVHAYIIVYVQVIQEGQGCYAFKHKGHQHEVVLIATTETKVCNLHTIISQTLDVWRYCYQDIPVLMALLCSAIINC